MTYEKFGSSLFALVFFSQLGLASEKTIIVNSSTCNTLLSLAAPNINDPIVQIGELVTMGDSMIAQAANSSLSPYLTPEALRQSGVSLSQDAVSRAISVGVLGKVQLAEAMLLAVRGIIYLNEKNRDKPGSNKVEDFHIKQLRDLLSEGTEALLEIEFLFLNYDLVRTVFGANSQNLIRDLQKIQQILSLTLSVSSDPRFINPTSYLDHALVKRILIPVQVTQIDREFEEPPLVLQEVEREDSFWSSTLYKLSSYSESLQRLFYLNEYFWLLESMIKTNPKEKKLARLIMDEIRKSLGDVIRSIRHASEVLLSNRFRHHRTLEAGKIYGYIEIVELLFANPESVIYKRILDAEVLLNERPWPFKDNPSRFSDIPWDELEGIKSDLREAFPSLEE